MSNAYTYTLSSTHGKFIQRAATANASADQYFRDLMLMLAQQLDGDGSQDSHYVTIAAAYGFPSTAVAHAAYSELSSAYAKTSGDGSVSSVRAARDQMVARFTV